MLRIRSISDQQLGFSRLKDSAEAASRRLRTISAARNRRLSRPSLPYESLPITGFGRRHQHLAEALARPDYRRGTVAESWRTLRPRCADPTTSALIFGVTEPARREEVAATGGCCS